jgi:hypothetical protein
MPLSWLAALTHAEPRCLRPEQPKEGRAPRLLRSEWRNNVTTISGEGNADRDLLAICWQPPSAAGAYGAFVLVELRGFEPLTSAMRTQPGKLTPPP